MAVCLMLDVDGVLIDGRPSDGLRWDHDLQKDLGVSSDALAESFFRSEWNDIVIGKKDLLPSLAKVLKRIAPTVQAEDLLAYWFKMDSRIIESVLFDIRKARRDGINVYLTTNQEHLRAAHLMNNMGLGSEVDGIVYSAKAGSKKPQPEFFRFAENVTRRQPHELILVDDTMSNVDAAKSEGWGAVHWSGSDDLLSILQHNAQK